MLRRARAWRARVMASRYDDALWRLVPEDSCPPPGHLRRFVAELGAVEDALDLGCGDGRLTLALEAASLVVADVSRVALERARRRLAGRPARFVELDPDAPLPLPDACFDLVLCTEILEHVRDVQLLLSEGRRVLRPGGRLAITTPANGRATALRALARGLDAELDPLSPHVRFLTRRSLRGLLDAMGFEVADLRRERGSLLAVASR